MSLEASVCWAHSLFSHWTKPCSGQISSVKTAKQAFQFCKLLYCKPWVGSSQEHTDLLHVIFLTLFLTSLLVLMKFSQLFCLINDLKSFINNNIYLPQQRQSNWKGLWRWPRQNPSLHSHICCSQFTPVPFCRKRHKTDLKELNQEAGFRCPISKVT